MEIGEIYKFAEENSVKLSLSFYPDVIWINHIIVKEKGKGIGGKLIRMLQSHAQSVKKDIKLFACDCYGSSLSKLFGIYTHLGFRHYRENFTKSNCYFIWEYK